MQLFRPCACRCTDFDQLIGDWHLLALPWPQQIQLFISFPSALPVEKDTLHVTSSSGLSVIGQRCISIGQLAASNGDSKKQSVEDDEFNGKLGCWRRMLNVCVVNDVDFSQESTAYNVRIFLFILSFRHFKVGCSSEFLEKRPPM